MKRVCYHVPEERVSMMEMTRCAETDGVCALGVLKGGGEE